MTKKSYDKQLEDFLSDWKSVLTSGRFYYIQNKQGKVVPFTPNESQLELYNNLHYFNVIPKARQRGFSTAIEILGLNFCVLNKGMNVGIIAHNLEDAKKIFKTKIKFPRENLGGTDENSVEYKVAQEIKKTIYPIKDNESTLEFSNGSTIYVSTSFRSGTIQFLHISEFGKIASKYPEKAKEILSGAIEAVGEGGYIFIESTSEGKNDFYVIVKHGERLKHQGKKLNHLEPKLFFFPWWQAPEYSLDDPDLVLEGETIKYFKMLRKEHGIEVTREQAKWWQTKKANLKELMGREYPSYLDEAFEMIVFGAYFKKRIEQLQKDGRYQFAPYDPRYPVYMAGDLGMRDAKDLGFFQLKGGGVYIIKWWRGSDMSFTDLHNSVLTKLGYPLHKIFLPHDAVKRNENDGFSVRDTAKELGYDVEVLQRSSIDGGINLVRDMFSSIIINSQDCTQPIKIGGEVTNFNLVEMLGFYKEEVDKVHGIGLGRPEHNDASHTGDMIRYLCQSVELIRQDSRIKVQEVYSPDFNDLM